MQSKKLAGVRYDVRGPILDEAEKLEAAGHEILKLNIGNVALFDFEAPPSIVAAMDATLPYSHAYSNSQGILPAREAVAGYYAGHGIEVSPDSVYLGNGVSELITLVLQALIDGGDEVLIPAPDYPLWTGATTLAGGVPVHYLADEANGWNPDLADIESKVTERTKALVVINPNNPTGAVYSPETMSGLADICRRHGLVLLADEIYELIVFDGQTHQHAAKAAGSDVFCITFSGLSKIWRVCGYRAGWAVLSGPLEDAADFLEGFKLLCNMRMCANVPGQQAVVGALTGPLSVEQMVVPGGRFYDQSKLAWRMLNEIPGVSCVEPQGALYLFPRLDPQMYPIVNDEAFVIEMLHAQHILVSHGRGFNWPTPDHFRLVALPGVDVLSEAIGRIGAFLETKRR